MIIERLKSVGWIVATGVVLIALFAMPVTAADQYVFTLIDNPAADTENGERTRAFGINAPGEIVGDFGRHGFFYIGGVFTTIDVPGADFTQAFGINAAGDIVGNFSNNTGAHGFLYSGGSLYHD